MHDCREVESKLIDLVFDELETDEKLRLLSETESCADCLDTRRSMTGTLVVFDRALEAASPAENYWQGYNQRLRRKLNAIEASAPEKRAPLWKRIFAGSLPVPVPIAAAIIIALLISSFLALRRSNADAAVITTQATTSSAPSAPVPVKIVEVPVVSERVVTRIVYVERKGRETNDARRFPTLIVQSKPSASARNAEDEQSGFITRANLAGFEPTSEVKIRMIRRSDEVEK